VLSAFATELGAVVGDLVVEPDQNEIVAAMALLKELPPDGAGRLGLGQVRRRAQPAPQSAPGRRPVVT